ncbi:hypothetical protein BDZ89DRAFT_1020150 [Hymenopellis radicata]|nr:hypothetical protein BDZ89DRAFT_1020150 [Hymenopellis radicata]
MADELGLEVSVAISSSSSAQNVAAYLRIASIAIAFYDCIETLPATVRFYREQWLVPRFMLSTLLFGLLQATSIIVLAVSNAGFFYSNFTDESCERFYRVPPIFKVLQAMTSQAILGVRTFNLSRRSSLILKLLLLSYGIACTLEWFTTMWKRIPVRDPEHVRCRAFSTDASIGAWMYYAVAMTYDLITTTVSVVFLLRFRLSSGNSLITKLVKMLLYDGLFFFAVLTAVNVVNLILYRQNQEIQTAATSMAYSVTWIMSQRLLIHLHNASRERRNESISTSVTITKDLSHSRHIQHAMRSQFESKPGIAVELTVPEFEMSYDGGPEEPEVHVRIEKTVSFQEGATTTSVRELEDYSRRTYSHHIHILLGLYGNIV